MKKREVEQLIYDEADKATPQAPAFEEVTKNVDWELVAEKCKPVRRRRWIMPTAVGVAAATAAAVTAAIITQAIINSSSANSAENRPVIYGEFMASDWECSDPSIDFSSERLNIFVDGDRATAVPTIAPINSSDHTPMAPLGQVTLPDKGGSYQCTITSSGTFFVTFRFDNFEYLDEAYAGYATRNKETMPFSISFPFASEAPKRVHVTFGDSTTSLTGSVYFKKIK